MKSYQPSVDWDEVYSRLSAAATDPAPVSGWTHTFYRYPARFSPRFAAAAIDCFATPADLVLDPYMGGGTSVVEALVAGREVVGNDLNSLAVFITKVKTTPLTDRELVALESWVSDCIPRFGYQQPVELSLVDPVRTKNLTLPRARFIKKSITAALSSLGDLPTSNARDFAKCVLLRVGQLALDGRRTHTPLSEFRENLAGTATEMIAAVRTFARKTEKSRLPSLLLNMNASELDAAPIFRRRRVGLVITSPPYPGVHVLYHRWQVDGRRETPAPYWIAGCNDGQGASFYNFADRRQGAQDQYFASSLSTLRAIRRVMRDGGFMVQMVAFNRPETQLPTYLGNMTSAGFTEVEIGRERIWREVPHRKWHASLNNQSSSANEVVLVHRAV